MFMIHWLRLGSNQQKAADRPETQLVSMSDRDCGEEDDDHDDDDPDGYDDDDDGNDDDDNVI